jgi:hypothetical protein
MPTARIRFLNPDALEQIRSVRSDLAEYYISLTPAGLLLICEPYENVTYSYPIEYSRQLMDLADNRWESVDFDDIDEISWSDPEDDDEGPVPDPVVFSYDLGFDPSVQECPVCYESFRDTNSMVALCGHGACMSCLKKMAEKKMITCPMCRSDSFKWLIGYASGHVLI